MRVEWGIIMNNILVDDLLNANEQRKIKIEWNQMKSNKANRSKQRNSGNADAIRFDWNCSAFC